MNFKPRMYVLIAMTVVVAALIVVVVHNLSLERVNEPEPPVGTYEVHMFFERQQNYL